MIPRTITHSLLVEYRNLTNEEFLNNELKELFLRRYFLITDSSKMKLKLMAYLDRVFPELESLVDVNTSAIRAILKEYPSTKALSEVRIDKLKK